MAWTALLQYDSTTIRLRSDYDVSRAPARVESRRMDLDGIRREQKINMSIFRRSRVVVVSQLNRTQIVISITIYFRRSRMRRGIVVS